MALIDQLREHVAEKSLIDGDGRGRPPTEEELARPHVAESAGKPLLPAGIVYQADWKKFGDGMARHARAQVSALAASGLPVALQSISSEGMFLDSDVKPEVRDEAGHLATVTLGQVVLAVRQAVFHSADFVRNLVVPAGGRLATMEHEEAIYASTVVYTSLERDRVSPVLIDIFKRCAEMWVPCSHNATALIRSGMPQEKVQIVPFPYDPASAVCRIPAPRGNERAPDGRRFYSIGKWEPRKEHARLLRAFLCAFTPKDKASLVLKVHGWGEWEGYPSIDQALAQCAADEWVRRNGWNDANVRRRVRVITDKVPDAEIVQLHADNNIYVSASHGEAWDIPAFEAKCAGNRLVHVGYGGSAEYASDDDVWIPYEMTPVHSAYGWEDSKWAEYEFEALVRALQKASPPSKRVHPRHFNGQFSAHAVGEHMKDRLLRIASRLHVEAPALLLRAGSYG